MNLKQQAIPTFNMLKWHAIVFIGVMASVWYGVFATMNSSGELVSLDTYKPLILQHIDLTLFWGVLLVIHLGIQQVRDYHVQQRQQISDDESGIFSV